jgi:Holliday junction DNA helicase RuvA
LKILSGISTKRFINALENEDLATLTSIPGLGKKTAQKIILKLKGKLALSEETSNHQYDDIIAALTGMGFDKKQSRESVNKIIEEIGTNNYNTEELEREILRRAIKHISSK